MTCSKSMLNDNVKARLMQPDGTYLRPKVKDDEARLNSQIWLLNHHQQAERE